MFDVGFSELLLIALVALIVIGPERLPKVARTAGILLGRLQRYVSDVKSDINREIQLEEIKKMQSDVTAQVRDMEQSVNEQMKTVETELNQSIAGGVDNKDAVADSETAPPPLAVADGTDAAPPALETPTEIVATAAVAETTAKV